MNKITLSKLHLWWGVILALPALLIGITCIFIAHHKALGTEHIELPAFLAPSEPVKEINAPRVWLANADGTVWLGGKYGLYLFDGKSAKKPAGLPAFDVQSILPLESQILVGGKQGIWLVEAQGAASREISPHEVWQITRQGTQIFAAGKKDIWFSQDNGKTFAQCESCKAGLQAWRETAAMPDNRSYNLEKLMMDIHTGKFFFGKKGEWIWIDILGITMIVLTLTGLILWLRRERQRKALGQ